MIAGSQVTLTRNRNRMRQLAGDVLGARERLRQVDLQGVGAPVVGDQPGADVNRHEEDEDALLAEELAEGLGLRREERGLREVGGDVDLDGADDERRPRHQHQRDEAALGQHGADAGARDDLPGACRRPRASRCSGDSPDRESALATPLPPRARTRLRASARSAADGGSARPRAPPAGTARGAFFGRARHEHAHDVLVGVVALVAFARAAPR